MPSVASLMIQLHSGWCPAVGCDASCCGGAPPLLLVWLFEADVLVPNIFPRLDSLVHTTKNIVTIRPSSGPPTPPVRTHLIGLHISFLPQILFTQSPFPCPLVQLVPSLSITPDFSHFLSSPVQTTAVFRTSWLSPTLSLVPTHLSSLYFI